MMARRAYNSKGNQFLDFEILEPATMAGQLYQLHVTYPKRSKSPATPANSAEADERFSVRLLLDTVYDNPQTLTDIGLTLNAVERARQVLTNLYEQSPVSATHTPTPVGSAIPDTGPTEGPFLDSALNETWRTLASVMQDGYEVLRDIDILEPNPKNRNVAMQNPRLRPFWMASEDKEMVGLWARNCFT